MLCAIKWAVGYNLLIANNTHSIPFSRTFPRDGAILVSGMVSPQGEVLHI